MPTPPLLSLWAAQACSFVVPHREKLNSECFSHRGDQVTALSCWGCSNLPSCPLLHISCSPFAIYRPQRHAPSVLCGPRGRMEPLAESAWRDSRSPVGCWSRGSGGSGETLAAHGGTGLLPKWLLLKHSSSWHLDCRCQAGCPTRGSHLSAVITHRWSSQS